MGKSQHYIPKFYLRRFKSDKEAKTIGLYNFLNNRHVASASIKHQACSDNFYDDDGSVESLLAQIEGDWAGAITKAIESQQAPGPNTTDCTKLKYFTCMQIARTEESAKDLNGAMTQIARTAFKLDPRFKKYADLSAGYERAALIAMDIHLNSMSVVKDLTCKLLVNNTELPLITSDQPIVRYNQFLERFRFPAGTLGLACKGLQMFVPLDSNHALLFYDGRVYKAGSRKARSLILHRDDVWNLNVLQALYCGSQIFFSEISQHHLHELIEMRKRHWTSDRHQMTEIGRRENPDGTTSIQYHGTKKEHRLRLRFSFMKETDHGKSYSLTGYAVEVRDESLRYKSPSERFHGY